MSAFIVADRSINRIVAFMAQAAYAKSGAMIYLSQPAREAADSHLLDRNEGREALAIAMHLMNMEAFNARYSESEEADGFAFNDGESPVSMIQTLKHLDCFLYQCSEGDIGERDLFKRLESFRQSLRATIIDQIPQYDAAEWG